LIIIEEADSRRIVDANTTAERSIANWRLTFNVGGVSFDLATAHGQDTTEVADAFAARLRLALAQGLT
jgi:hypothetical protein